MTYEILELLMHRNSVVTEEALSPLAVLARGYAAIGKGDATVQSVNEVDCGDVLRIRFSDGSVYAAVERKDDLNG